MFSLIIPNASNNGACMFRGISHLLSTYMNEKVSITDLQWNRIAFIANVYWNISDTISRRPLSFRNTRTVKWQIQTVLCREHIYWSYLYFLFTHTHYHELLWVTICKCQWISPILSLKHNDAETFSTIIDF